MLLTLEMVLMLKGVEMLSEMAEDVLAIIAPALQEIQVRAEETPSSSGRSPAPVKGGLRTVDGARRLGPSVRIALALLWPIREAG